MLNASRTSTRTPFDQPGDTLPRSPSSSYCNTLRSGYMYSHPLRLPQTSPGESNGVQRARVRVCVPYAMEKGLSVEAEMSGRDATCHREQVARYDYLQPCAYVHVTNARLTCERAHGRQAAQVRRRQGRLTLVCRLPRGQRCKHFVTACEQHRAVPRLWGTEECGPERLSMRPSNSRPVDQSTAIASSCFMVRAQAPVRASVARGSSGRALWRRWPCARAPCGSGGPASATRAPPPPRRRRRRRPRRG